MSRELTDEDLKRMWSQHAPIIGGVLTYARAVIEADRALRVPMTRDEIFDAFTAAEKAAGEDISPFGFDQGIRAAERHHGIGEKA